MTHWSIRKTASREAQISRLGKMTGLGDNFAGVVEFALSYTIAKLKQEGTMYTQAQDYIVDAIVADGGWETIVASYSGKSADEILADLNDWNVDGRESRAGGNGELAQMIYDELN